MPGFENAGVTKGMMIMLGVTSLATSLLDVKPYLHLQLVPHITTYHQIWRVATHPLAFANSTELLVAELLLYNVGVGIERSFGSRKYASFVLISSLLSTLLACIFILVLYPLGINSIPGGPYGIIFSLLWQHYRVVPALYQFGLLGVTMTNKTFTWVLALQLLSSNPPSSILISLLGLFSGYIYRTDTLFPLPSFSLSRRRLLVRRPLKTYRIPLSLHNLLARLFSPLVGDSAPPRRSDRVLPGQVNERRGAGALGLGIVGTGGASATGAGTGVETVARPTLRSLLTSRLAADRRTQSNTSPGGSPTAGMGGDDEDERGEGGEPGSTTAAMGEWVSEMTGRGGTGARAPTDEEIATLRNMFPNLGRDVIVSALQRNDYNTAQAVEALLEENS